LLLAAFEERGRERRADVLLDLREEVLAGEADVALQSLLGAVPVAGTGLGWLTACVCATTPAVKPARTRMIEE